VTLHPSPRRSFYIAVFRTVDHSEAWCWEIRRKRKPMGVRLWQGGFRSHRAALSAGKAALEDFFNGLAMDASSRVRERADVG
jgi:hypothetical protein